MPRSINSEGLRIIEHFEGLQLKAYQDIKGIWTIGYGSTSNVQPGMVITQQEAESRLKQDLATAESGVERCIRVPLTDNQFSACVSLCFNIGQGAFGKSTLVRLINEKKYIPAADCFLDWCKSNGQRVDGLFARRRAERDLYLCEE